jgi:hypothetical protein
VGPRAGLDGCGKSRPPTGIRSPYRESLYRQLSWPVFSVRYGLIYNVDLFELSQYSVFTVYVRRLCGR